MTVFTPDKVNIFDGSYTKITSTPQPLEGGRIKQQDYGEDQ